MRKTDVIEHFRSAAAAARALGISLSAVSQWGEIVPYYSATQLAEITGGDLKVEPSLYGAGGRILQGPGTAEQPAA